MIGILILGVMQCTYGSNCPYKEKLTSLQDLSLIFNLQALFAVSWYTTSNSILVNTLVGIAMTQFVVFIFYQKAPWVKSVTFSTMLVRQKLVKCFKFSQLKPSKTQQEVELHNAIPEVAYNYREFREPLIGLDLVH